MTFTSAAFTRDVGVVSGHGRLDFRSADELRAAVTELIEQGRIRIVVDLGGIVSLDSSGTGALVYSLKAARERNGDLMICGAAPQPAMLLSRFNLDRVIRACSSVESAYVDRDARVPDEEP